jgi:hypothetical protein
LHWPAALWHFIRRETLWFSRRRQDISQATGVRPDPTTSPLLWIALSALGSLALISITSFVAQNIASIPLIWVAPLSIYLITFVLAFGSREYRGWLISGPALVLAGSVLLTYRSQEFTSNIALSLPLFMACLFFVCLACHGELAASKPEPKRLTFFYIMVSLGGALGSLLGSILAPLLLSGDFEMPLTLAAVGIICLYLRRHDTRASRVAALAMAIALSCVAGWQMVTEVGEAKLLTRNFYSALRIVEYDTSQGKLRKMEHGGVEHGSQLLDRDKSLQPVSYYGPTSGVSLAIRRQRELAGRPIAAGLVGLGAGALAAYGQAGDRFRFYEINPQVIGLAQSHFSYLRESKASVTTALGDARLVLEAESPQNFDLLAIDAFSGDGIPMHLLTREATFIDRKHVAPSGVLLFHVSNHFVDLQPALARLAADQGLVMRVVADEPDGAEDIASPLSASTWVMMAADQHWFDTPDLLDAIDPPEPPPPGAVWTDDFNDILSAVRLED